MYSAYFVNVNTGQLFISARPSDNMCDASICYPSFNVEGWSRVEDSFFILLSKVSGYGFVAGIEAQSNSQKENK